MFLAALALISHPPVQTPAVRSAIATIAPQNPLSAGDYPYSPRAILKTITTGVKLTVGTSGRVESCAVVSTSGWPALDAALCSILARMQSEPARDIPNSGIYSRSKTIDEQTMPGTHVIFVTWKPPRLW
jgi:outer membrane biosynthesis protein TonB